MKKSFFFSLLATIAFVGMSFTLADGTGTPLNVDTQNSVVTWKGYKVTGEHAGKINIKNGNLTFDKGVLTGGSFEIDMNSITCTDLQGEWADKLVGHLKSDDFFGVSSYPTSKFVVTKVISRGKPGEYKLVGNLTIKNKTKEIKFDANVKESGANYVAEAAIKIDRTDFDVRYGSGSFFDSLGDKTIYDEFDLNVKVVTKK
jgi:polyisoprenoid-binding protein YceI